jgi:CRP-like cAMP-binding protein
MGKGPEPLSDTVSPLDEAHGKLLAGKVDDAVRDGIMLLEGDVHDLHAAGFLARALIKGKRPFLAAEVATRLVDAFTRRGDLAQATAFARLAGEAGEKLQPLMRKVADAFGKGSRRVGGDSSPLPPPLPHEEKGTPSLPGLTGESLLERAEKTLQKFLSTEDNVPIDQKVPELPLFGALMPDALERLLTALVFEEHASGKVIVQQGDAGHEAFILVRGLLHVIRKDTEGEEHTIAALGPGSIFGEMALVSDAPRAASVIAAEPAQVLRATREDLEKLNAKEPAIGRELGDFCRTRMLTNLMRTSAILGSVDPAARPELIAKFETRAFEPDEALVVMGADGEGLYLIASGFVRVYGRDADGDRIQVARLGPGDVVGEISLVLRRPATADVVAEHPTIALLLSRDRFTEAIKEHPTLLGQLYELATKRDEQMRSVVAQETLDAGDVILL